jgi:hypothetical protein
LVDVTHGGIRVASRTEQLRAQEFRVRTRQAESRNENTSLVAPTRVQRIQAVVAQLNDVHYRVFASGQFHLETSVTDSPPWGGRAAFLAIQVS